MSVPAKKSTTMRHGKLPQGVVVAAPGSAAPAAALPAKPSTVAPARSAAFHILHKVATTAAHSDDMLHTPAVDALSHEDRNLTTALVLGVLRWQLQLDTVLRPMLQRPDAELHPAARLALRMGAFQLLHMERVPAHAVLNDSVELARSNGAPHAAGMVNALLRRLLREQAAPARTRIAEAMSPAERAHPEWLIARWRANFGGVTARRIAEYDQHEPPANGLFTDHDDVRQMDDGSRLIAELAAACVTAPLRILDCCAAPGGKTAMLARRHPNAHIVAADVNEKRLNAMSKRLARDPATADVQCLIVDMTMPPGGAAFTQPFDLILCDAPCSGTGTLARNPEIRHRLRGSDLARQAERQTAILNTALQLLSPQGRLVYATCSLEPEENEGVVNAVLANGYVQIATGNLVAGLTTLKEGALRDVMTGDALRTIPGTQACDGFYAAVLQRRPV